MRTMQRREALKIGLAGGIAGMTVVDGFVRAEDKPLHKTVTRDLCYIGFDNQTGNDILLRVVGFGYGLDATIKKGDTWPAPPEPQRLLPTQQYGVVAINYQTPTKIVTTTVLDLQESTIYVVQASGGMYTFTPKRA
jgi:hypothetical protein